MFKWLTKCLRSSEKLESNSETDTCSMQDMSFELATQASHCHVSYTDCHRASKQMAVLHPHVDPSTLHTDHATTVAASDLIQTLKNHYKLNIVIVNPEANQGSIIQCEHNKFGLNTQLCNRCEKEKQLILTAHTMFPPLGIKSSLTSQDYWSTTKK